jgi:hypothetical protein
MDPSFVGGTFVQLLFFISSLAPIWFPIVLVFVAWHSWLRYVRLSFISGLKWTLLEIRLPRDVFKSPQAMEIALVNAFHQGGGVGTWYAKYYLGKVLMWFSLEIVSIDGNVFFFIRIPLNFKSLVESQIYAQYPQAEIKIVEDYTDRIPHEMKTNAWSMWGTEFEFTKPDVYPIKTYVDYGLDKSTSSLDPEQQIDPMTQMIEFMGSLGKGEQLWLQIIIQVHSKRFSEPGKMFGGRNWQGLAKEEIQKIVKDGLLVTGDEKIKSTLNLTKTQQDVITAIDRHIEKPAFDTGIRAIYLAEKDKFNPINIVGLLGMFKQYNSNTLNGFKPRNPTDFDYPWQDRSGARKAALKLEMFEAYRLRSYFNAPHSSKKVAGKHLSRKPLVLSSEELATLFHFPGRVSETPSFGRIESKKIEPPQNLPL